LPAISEELLACWNFSADGFCAGFLLPCCTTCDVVAAIPSANADKSIGWSAIGDFFGTKFGRK